MSWTVAKGGLREGLFSAQRPWRDRAAPNREKDAGAFGLGGWVASLAGG